MVGEDVHPLVHVDEVEQARDVVAGGRVVGRRVVGGGDEVEDVRVVVGGASVAARLPVEAVARELVGAAGGLERLERRAGRGEGGVVVLELEPHGDLVVVAFLGGREPGLRVVGGRHLLVLREVVELAAVPPDLHVVRVQVGDAHLLADPGAELVAQAGRLLAAVAGRAEDAVGHAQQRFVVRPGQRVAAAAAVEGAAFVAEARVVDHAEIPVD